MPHFPQSHFVPDFRHFVVRHFPTFTRLISDTDVITETEANYKTIDWFLPDSVNITESQTLTKTRSIDDIFSVSDDAILSILNQCFTEEQEFSLPFSPISNGYLSKITRLPKPIHPALFYPMLYSHPNSERVRWFQSRPNPLYNPDSEERDYDEPKWIREEQIVSDTMAIVTDAKNMRRYYPEGQFEDGDVVIMAHPDELPLSEHDWVIPIGKRRYTLNTEPDARTFTRKEWVRRGENLVLMEGKVSSSGTTILGEGTNFLTQYNVGNIIKVGNEGRVIMSIASQTSLTVDTAPTPAWSSNNHYKGTESLLYAPIARLRRVDDVTRTYNLQTQVRVGSDEQSLDWFGSVSPAYGSVVTVTYEYYPKYVILYDLGSRHHVTGGRQLPRSYRAKLVLPDDFRKTN